jgi:hypothetical protein
VGKAGGAGFQNKTRKKNKTKQQKKPRARQRDLFAFIVRARRVV